MVHHLGIRAVSVPVKVRNSLYMSVFCLHENAAPPIGVRSMQAFAQGRFDDILQIRIERRHDIQTIDFVFDGHVLPTSAHTLPRTDAIDAGELFVKALFQACIAVSAFAVDTADSAACQTTEGFHAPMLIVKFDA